MKYFNVSTKDMNTLIGLSNQFGYKNAEIPTLIDFKEFTNMEDYIKRKMVKFVDADGIVQVVNFDCTLSMAQIFSKSPEYMPIEKKIAYLSKTLYTDSKRKIKETTVWGMENYNENLLEADGEQLFMAIQSLINLSIENFKIDLGSIEFIHAMLQSIPAESTKEILALIEEKNIFELTSLLDSLNITDKQKQNICKIPLIFGSFKQSVERAKAIALNTKALAAIERLETIYNFLDTKNFAKYMMLDMGFTNTYHYYSGIIFKAYVNDYSKIILQGGRYDKLMRQMESAFSACGFTIDFNNLKEVRAYDNYSYMQRKNSQTSY